MESVDFKKKIDEIIKKNAFRIDHVVINRLELTPDGDTTTLKKISDNALQEIDVLLSQCDNNDIKEYAIASHQALAKKCFTIL